MSRRKFFVPEVVQTSGMDCGPASLKALLSGFGVPVHYGRLREACQTDVDGTSIDTMETVANQLGLNAEQIMVPVDHVLLPQAKSLPAIAVVTLPNGLTHFVVVWRRYRDWLQLMDPSTGRRWVSHLAFERELYRHKAVVPAQSWREFAGSPEFLACLRERMARVGAKGTDANGLLQRAVEDTEWKGLAALDAAVRLTTGLRNARAMKGSPVTFIGKITANPNLIPQRYWTVVSATDEDGEPRVTVTGAVLVRVIERRVGPALGTLGTELKAAISEHTPRPLLEILEFIRESGVSLPAITIAAVATAAGGTLVESLIFRGLFDLGSFLSLPLARFGALGAALVFSVAVLLLEFPISAAALRAGRHLELRLRIAFLAKIPRLNDRYFQSRLISDMGERSHATHRLRHVPELARQLLRAGFEFVANCLAIVWLMPASWPWIVALSCGAVLPPLLVQPLLAERDLRARSHAAGLMRFYLDALSGFSAIKAHVAERTIQREYDQLLCSWSKATMNMQRAVVGAEALQLFVMFALMAGMMLSRSLGPDIGRTLLVVYWLLNLPVLGQSMAAIARQYPYYRSLTIRLLEPLGSPEDARSASTDTIQPTIPPTVEFQDVSVAISNHTVLSGINLRIEPGTHTAIVGASGAGKSSLASILLGFLKPSSGTVLVDGKLLDTQTLHRQTAWVDPAVHIWNRSLHANVLYGAEDTERSFPEAIASADLRQVIERLPEGLQTHLGEGGALISGGEGQRVRFARALARDQVRLVILDEPFRGLDREKRRMLMERARDYWNDRTLICITHDVAETKSFDRVVVVENGQITEQGAPEELASDQESRYAQLLFSEKQLRSGLWSSKLWRRIRVQNGRLIEDANAIWAGDSTRDVRTSYTEEKAS